MVIKKDIEHHLKLAAQYSQRQLRCNLLMYHEIVLRLIGNDKDESLSGQQDSLAWEESEASHQIFLSFYLGHIERVDFKAKLWEEQDKPKLVRCVHLTVLLFQSSLQTLFSIATSRPTNHHTEHSSFISFPVWHQLVCTQKGRVIVSAIYPPFQEHCRCMKRRLTFPSGISRTKLVY